MVQVKWLRLLKIEEVLNLYAYIAGLALLFGGTVTFNASLGALDDTPVLQSFKFFGGLLFLVLFVTGFFLYQWWVPVASILVSLVLWMMINTVAFSVKGGSFLIAFRCHLGIVLGTILCLIGIFGN